MIIPENMSSESNAISKLKKLSESNCKIEKIQPPVMASDAEVNIVIVILLYPDSKRETIKANREEAVALREFIKLINRFTIQDLEVHTI
jgi:hypothetical protein